MNASADTFATFIDAVTIALDEGNVRTDEQAANAFLSRSHFDRLIRSAAGEPPATFRRRVLLERSAYRLITSQAGVLEIALESGYSSNEAFARAFRRAYGKGPAEFRRSPTQVQLPTPSNVHFHPPGGLRLPTRSEMTPMELIIRMVEHHVWLVGEMVDRASLLDDAALDRPIEVSVEGIDDDLTIRRLLSRLIGQMDMWNNVIHDKSYDWDIESHEAIDAMKVRLSKAGGGFLDEVKQVVAENRLDETFIDAHCQPPEVFTYGGLIAHVLTFAAHRRTLVVGALWSAGITDLGYGDPRKWVAEAA